MLDESTYLPYVAAPLPQGPWLVISPHPDDETFGLGGALLLATEQGITADVLFLTSGDKGGPEGIESARELEAREAAKLLGIREVSFWRLPDRELLAYESVIKRMAEIITSTRPSCVFFPSPVEPHPDHRVSGVIAWEALRKTGFSANPWSYEISVQGPVNHLIDISQVAERKRDIMAVYASQMAQNDYAGRILSLNQSRTWSLPLHISHAEAFYAWPKQDKPLNAMLLALQTQYFGVDAMPGKVAKVSVIIRTKDRPIALREAIVSVATQTHRDIELVVVNDGGTDVSEIIRHYATGSIGSVVYETLHPSRGRVGAANAGLDFATGEFLLFLNDDDFISPEHIAKLAKALEANHSAVLAYTNCKMIDVPGNEAGECTSEFEPYQLMIGNQFPIHAALFSRSQASAGNCRFDPNLAMFEDWDFWLQLHELGCFQHVPGISATYRIEPRFYGTSSLGYLKIRDKWRSRWPDNWLGEAFDNAQKATSLKKTLEEQNFADTHKVYELNSELHITKQKLIQLSRETEKLRNELNAHKRLLANAESVYKGVLNSRTWRVTEFPRKLVTWLRSACKPGK